MTTLEIQAEAFKSIQTLCVNYGKDSKVRKTAEYLTNKLLSLEDLWHDFDERNLELLQTEDKNTPYFVEKVYEKTKELYSKTKADILNLMRNSMESKNNNPPPPPRPTTNLQFGTEPETSDRNHITLLRRQLQSNMKCLDRTLEKISVTANIERWDLEDYINNIKSKWETIEKQHWELDSLGQIYETEEEKYIYLEGIYEETKTALNKKLWDSVHRQKSTPKIDIPEFNGSYNQWHSFKDLFIETIHNNFAIPKCQKMQHLKSKLRGEAEKLVQHLKVSAENYDSCWEILTHRYNNKRLLFTSYMNTIVNLPTIQQPTSFNIKKMHDTILECINGLHNMGLEIDALEPIVVYLMSQKLDAATFGEYTKDLQEPRELPNFNEFMNFLENKFITLEAQRGRQKNDQPSTSINSKPSQAQYQKGFKHEFHKSFHTSSRMCPLCNQDHVLMNCAKFIDMNTKSRADTVAKLQVCRNCLFSHGANKCTSMKTCKQCNLPHHTLLHVNSTASSSGVTSGGTSGAGAAARTYNGQRNLQQYNSSHVSEEAKEVLLATMRIQVKSVDGTYLTLKCLVDQGSQVNLLTQEASQLLRLPRKNRSAVISGIGSNSGNCKGAVNLTCKSIYSDYSFETEALIMTRITNKLPNVSFDKENWPHLQNLKLADPEYNISQSIDLLLGAEVYASIILDGVLKGNKNAPVAQQTQLGWILSGSIPTFNCHVTLLETENLTKFWETEDIIEDARTSRDDFCENFYQQTTTRSTDGKYVVKMPFKPDLEQNLGKSWSRAASQFYQLEKRFTKQPILAEMYRDFINEYLELGHMKPAPPLTNQTLQCLLPHHGVLRAHSSTTRLRVVFNASMRTDSNFSLNELMEKGPNLQTDIQALLIKWRLFEVAYCADIEKMYICIWIDEEQQPLQKIIWRNSPSEPLREMQLCTLTYGMKSAPWIAIRTLHQLAKDEGKNYPKAAKILMNDFYVDDVISGNDTIAEALETQKQLIDLLKKGGFNLRKWSSNKTELLTHLQDDQISSCLLNFKQEDSMKTLGISWNPRNDTFMFNWELPETHKKPTKRTLLSEISKLYDPLGWISPVTVGAKLLFQRVWLSQTGWDEPLPEEITKEWIKLRTELPIIKQIKMKRWIGTVNKVIELFGFADASEKAYACVVYSRGTSPDGQTKISLIAAKTRVVPLNTKTSLPRLELCGALLLSKLMAKITKTYKDREIVKYAWCDSQVALAWIQGDANRWEPFVRNRVLKIKAEIPADRWHFIVSASNAADCATRSILPSKLINLQLWWSGPDFLTSKSFTTNNNVTYTTEIGRKKQYETNLITTTNEANFIDILLEKHSSLTYIKRVTAWIMRFINKTRYPSGSQCNQKPSDNNNYLSSGELNEAINRIIKQVQQSEFADEVLSLKKNSLVSTKSRIFKLSPLLDEQGLLRVGGRLQHSNLPYNMKKPLILPYKGKLTQLIIEHAHQLTLHGGARLTLAYIRQKYWIISGNRAVKEQIRKCVKCHRYKTHNNYQLMSDLPEMRVTPSRPFSHCGIDYTGNVDVKINKGRGVRTSKGYIAIFICMVTKAVHIELVSDLTTDSFIAALKRLCARRGTPQHIYTDNGSYFKCGAKILRSEFTEFKKLLTPLFFNKIEELEIKFHFNAPIWPTAGGLWEAAVRSMKHHLKRVLGEQKLTYEQFSTLLAEVEACLNSRPLCQLTEDVEEFDNYLTPGHFLTGGPILSVPQQNIEEKAISIRNRWKLTEKMHQQIWKRWSEDYLTQLQSRSKWHKPTKNLQVNDVVLLKENNIPPGKWALGRVIELHPGADGHVRVTTIKTQKGILKRPITKLAPLPIANENEERELNNIKKKTGTVNLIMKTFLTMLMIFTCIGGTSATTYNNDVTVTSLTENQPIYFDEMGSLQVAHDEWILLVYYNLTNYFTTITKLENYVKHINETCQSLDKMICKTSTEQLQHELEMIEQYNTLLLNHQQHFGNRKKRGLINGIGYVANSLFGVLDQRFADKYQQDIQAIQDNENYLMELTKNQTSIVEIENKALKKNEEMMNKQYETIEKFIEITNASLWNVTTILDTIISFNYFQATSLTASLLINNVKSTQEMLVDTWTDLYHGRIGVHLFTPGFMIKTLTDIASKLPKGLSLPIREIEKEIKDIYKLLYLRGRITEDYFLFEVHIPLISENQFKIYRVIPVPVNFKQVTPTAELIAVDLEKNWYLSMKHEDLQTCLVRDKNNFICSTNQPMLNLLSMNLPCEARMISHRPLQPCNVIPTSCEPAWIQLQTTNEWLNICCGNCTIRIICEDRITTKRTSGAAVISLAQGCLLQESGTTIYAHNIFNNSAMWKDNLQVPTIGKVTSINELVRETMKNMPKLQPGKYNFTDELQIEDMLRFQRAQERLPKAISSHDTHQYVVAYLALGASIIGLLIYLCRRWKCRQNSNTNRARATTLTQDGYELPTISKPIPSTGAKNVAFVFDDNV